MCLDRLQPGQQCLVQHIGHHWLGNVVVHTCGETDLTVFVKGIGEDGGLGIARERADVPRGINAIEIRHLHIHQDQGVPVLAGQFQRLLAALGEMDRQPDNFGCRFRPGPSATARRLGRFRAGGHAPQWCLGR